MRNLSLSVSLACGVMLAASTAGEYRISGPFTHDNLSIFLIHGKAGGRTYLTLKDALEQKKVAVYETQNVNQLAIENKSEEDVFVQGGDIVKGGQQDRLITNDFVLPARSGRMPVAAFCVEPGRWTQRGAEPAKMFNSSTETVSNKDMAIASRSNKSQQEVWREVAKAQDGLEANAPRVLSAGGGNVGGVASGVASAIADPVRAPASPSSLQLTLESKAVTDAVEGYIKALSGAINGKPDVIGFAFAVNGEVNSADIYASPALFQAMWSKLLKSSAVEAVRRSRKDQKFPAVPVSAIETLLGGVKDAKESTMEVGRVKLVSRDAGKQLMFESRDGEVWIHRNYIQK